MDVPSKEKFKMKFYFLAVQLNAIILIFAVGVMLLFIGPVQYRIPIFIITLLITLVLSFYFIKKYKETQAWLDEHGDKGKDT
jgi:membrane protein implicated in regulation of membrane protease activity